MRCTLRQRDGATASFEVRPDEPVLDAVRRERIDLAVGCRGGGCGVCRVQVVQGAHEVRKMSKRHVTDEERAAGYALACRLYACEDLVLLAAPAPGR